MKNDIKKYLTLGAALAGSAFMVSCDGDDVTVVEGSSTTDVQPTQLALDLPADLSNTQIDDFKVTNTNGDAPALNLQNGTFSDGNTRLLQANFGAYDLSFDPAVISGNTVTLNNITVLGQPSSAPTQAVIDGTSGQAAGTSGGFGVLTIDEMAISAHAAGGVSLLGAFDTAYSASVLYPAGEKSQCRWEIKDFRCGTNCL